MVPTHQVMVPSLLVISLALCAATVTLTCVGGAGAPRLALLAGGAALGV